MKMKQYLMMGLAVLALASCNEDFGDWAQQPTNEQTGAISFAGASFTAADVIKFAELPDSVQTVKVVNFTSPASSTDAAYAPTYNLIVNGEDLGVVSAEGEIARENLEAAFVATYGKRPVERELSAQLQATMSNGSTATKIVSDAFAVKAVPEAPEIDVRYYITGGINGWDNTDTTYPVSNSGADPYDDPVFVIMLSAEQVGEGFEFKLTPEKGLGGDWSECIVAGSEEGKLADKNAGGNLALAKIDGASFYRVEFNLLDQTWSVRGLNFNQYIYAVGNFNGWSDNGLIALSTVNYDGSYKGFGYLDGEFKFRPNTNNWVGDWGQNPNGNAGTLVVDGEVNCGPADAGYYMLNVDLAAMTWSITPISTIGIIGSAVNGDTSWGTEYAMSYDRATNLWSITTDLTAGEVKFRANNGWDINWGGTPNNATQGGDNIVVTEAGNYTLTLSALCDGQARYTITKN